MMRQLLLVALLSTLVNLTHAQEEFDDAIEVRSLTAKGGEKKARIPYIVGKDIHVDESQIDWVGRDGGGIGPEWTWRKDVQVEAPEASPASRVQRIQLSLPSQGPRVGQGLLAGLRPPEWTYKFAPKGQEPLVGLPAPEWTYKFGPKGPAPRPLPPVAPLSPAVYEPPLDGEGAPQVDPPGDVEVVIPDETDEDASVPLDSEDEQKHHKHGKHHRHGKHHHGRKHGKHGWRKHVQCEGPPNPGPCRAAFPRFYYDPASNSCRRFTYGGCGEFNNNWAEHAQCENVCVRKSKPKRCRDKSGDLVFLPHRSRHCPLTKCPHNCPQGYHHDRHHCPTCHCQGRDQGEGKGRLAINFQYNKE